MLIMKKATNPIAITPQALAGRRLEAGWQQNLGNTGGTFDRRKLEDMWKTPNWSGKSNGENLIQDARLSTWKETLGEK
jgi:hypothetical protein